jgi:hypothetical protein
MRFVKKHTDLEWGIGVRRHIFSSAKVPERLIAGKEEGVI